MQKETRLERAFVVGPQAFLEGRALFSARMEAGRLLTEARGRAEEILEQARARAEEVRLAAQRQGREEGLAQVTQLLVQARAEAHRMREEAEDKLVALAVRIAERILGAQVDLHPEVVLNVARKASQQVSWCRKFVFRVHPEDLAFLRAHKGQIVDAAGEVDVQVVPDESVDRGGCILETEVGRIDATLRAQLAALEATLQGR